MADPDTEEAADLATAIQTLIDGKRYRIAIAAIGVVLTELAVAHGPPKQREKFLQMILAGVRRDWDAANGTVLLIEGQVVWH